MMVEFVVVGHVTRDLARDGWRLGGTVTFAAVQAHRLGCGVGIVTSATDDVIARVRAELAFAEIAVAALTPGPSPTGGEGSFGQDRDDHDGTVDVGGVDPSRSLRMTSPTAMVMATTTFENVYDGGHRTQYIREQGAPIGHEAVPEGWRSAPVVLLGPVWGELAADYASAFDAASLVGVSAQGWLRTADADARVRHTAWTGEPFWRGCDVLFVSDEDLAGERDDLERWCREVPIVVMTASSRGGHVYSEGRWRRMDAYPEDEVDPTGAGDTFATGFLIRLHETGDVAEAARFGAAAASLSVRGIGAAAMPERAEVEERMRQYPDVALR